jgi:catechol 2,3-dioxygenase-like lactoylglutathione lyase family enzyme
MTSNLGIRASLRCLAVLALSAPAVTMAQSVFTHAHMRVPEGQQAAAADWYHEVLGGELAEIGPGPIIRHHNGFVGTMANEGPAGDGAESVIDHVGIAVADVRAAVRTEPRTAPVPGDPLIAHLTDPWGGRFELVEETGWPPGIHHIHLYASDAEVMRDWFLSVFGGENDTTPLPFKRIRYDDIWIVISQAADDDRRESSRFRVTDHIGFRVPSLDAFRDTLAASGYEPYLERPNPPGADLMFFEGPDGLHVEMTEPAPR